MEDRSWDRPVGEGEAATLTVRSADSETAVRYRIAFPFLVGDQSADEIQLTGDGSLDDH